MDFARKAITEYKRFVYLAVRARHAVTPSIVVDEVWHLHLTYTDSYWNEMCATILEAPLHHKPTLGGAVEDQRFLEQYKRTLSSYERAFETPPPAEFWPEPKTRFEEDGDQIRVHRKDYWLVPKPGKLARATALTTTLVSLAMAGNVIADDNRPEGEGFGYVVWILIGLIAAVLLYQLKRLLTAASKSKKRGKGDTGGWFGGCGADCGSSGCGGGCGS